MIRLRRAALAAAFLTAAAPPRDVPQVVLGAEDYPAGVTPGRSEKQVLAAFSSAADGKTVHCTIVTGSRVKALDAASCDILLRRAHFASAGEQRILFRWVERRRGTPPPLQRRGDPLLVNIVVGSSIDYPEGAAARGEQGTVAFEIDVSPMGAPGRCRITEPSASATLNAWTCAHVLERAVFIPSVDADSKAVAGVYRSRINWRLD